MKVSRTAAILLAILFPCLPACNKHPAGHAEQGEHAAEHGEHAGEHPEHGGEHAEHGEHAEGHHEVHRLVVTNPVRKDVTSTREYVSQIHSCRHIEVRALDTGYLEEIPVKEGQFVEEKQLLFKIIPVLYQAKLNSEMAEAKSAQIEFEQTNKLFQDKVVSAPQLALAKAKLERAEAKVQLARAEFNFSELKAPFSGIIDRLHNQKGSLIEEGDILTTLSDNSTMWVYFNVPEARYLEYKKELDNKQKLQQQAQLSGQPGAQQHANDDPDMQIELKLADSSIFNQHGVIGAIEADFNNETGNIAFRADFPNPEGLLRHGQTGTVRIKRGLKNVVVIPQRATFEILDKRYAYVVDETKTVHQRPITVLLEQDDIYVIKEGLEEGEIIVLEGIRQVRDGEKVEYELKPPAEVLSDLKKRAE